MAITVQLTRTVQLPPDRVFVQWELAGAYQAGPYLSQLFRSHGSNGPWTLIASGTNLYSFVDKLPNTTPTGDSHARPINLLSLARDFYYRVVVTPPGGIQGQAEAVSQIEPTLDGRQKNARRKMLRDELVLLKKGNGVPVAVCKKTRWGERCTKCVDVTTGEIIRGECLACYGTGFLPGYQNPVLTWARRSPSAVQSQVAPAGKVDLNLVQITLLDVPQIQDDDLLIFLRDNRRYIVKQAASTELRTVTVHQEVTASELARSSIEYRLHVDPRNVPPLF